MALALDDLLDRGTVHAAHLGGEFEELAAGKFVIEERLLGHVADPAGGLADVAHMDTIPQTRQELGQPRDLGAQGLHQPAFTVQLEVLPRHGASQGIRRVGVAVKKSLELIVFAEEGVKNLLRRERRRHRQITAGQALGQAKKIRLNILLVLAGK